MTHGYTILGELGQLHDDYTALFPDHLPEVGNSVWQRSLGGNVGRVPWVVVGLEEENIIVEMDRDPESDTTTECMTPTYSRHLAYIRGTLLQSLIDR